jgi:mRNA interferase RelE/StbE
MCDRRWSRLLISLNGSSGFFRTLKTLLLGGVSLYLKLKQGIFLAWTIEYDPDAVKHLLKLDKPVRQRIDKYLTQVAANSDPRSFGRMLGGNLAGLWRYRVGSYLLICKLLDNRLVVYVVDVDHRSIVYHR